MKLFQSIRFRIVLGCILFAIIVSISYGWVTFYGVKYNSDEIFNWYITQEAELLLEKYQQDPNQDLSAMTTATVLIANERQVLDQLAGYFPETVTKNKLRKATSLDQVKLSGPTFKTAQGFVIYEFSNEDVTIHVLKAVMKNNLEFYYIVDVSEFINYDNYSEKAISNLFFTMLALILVLSLAVGIQLARRVLSPLTRLADSVDANDFSDYRGNQESYYNDEIGFLAKRIDSFVTRTNEFIEREKAFSRDVSHELRTPLASSRAAIELALSHPDGKHGPINKFLLRVFRANKDMTHLIETFLLLGREGDERLNQISFNLSQLVENSFEKHAYLKRSADIGCLNKVDPRLKVIGPKQYLSIIIDNLVRNALQHTTTGSVSVCGDEHQLVVEDTGEGMSCQIPADDKVDVLEKSGVGLTIVRRLSEQQGWTVNIDSQHGEGTRVTIVTNMTVDPDDGLPSPGF